MLTHNQSPRQHFACLLYCCYFRRVKNRMLYAVYKSAFQVMKTYFFSLVFRKILATVQELEPLVNNVDEKTEKYIRQFIYFKNIPTCETILKITHFSVSFFKKKKKTFLTSVRSADRQTDVKHQQSTERRCVPIPSMQCMSTVRSRALPKRKTSVLQVKRLMCTGSKVRR